MLVESRNHSHEKDFDVVQITVNLAKDAETRANIDPVVTKYGKYAESLNDEAVDEIIRNAEVIAKQWNDIKPLPAKKQMIISSISLFVAAAAFSVAAVLLSGTKYWYLMWVICVFLVALVVCVLYSVHFSVKMAYKSLKNEFASYVASLNYSNNLKFMPFRFSHVWVMSSKEIKFNKDLDNCGFESIVSENDIDLVHLDDKKNDVIDSFMQSEENKENNVQKKSPRAKRKNRMQQMKEMREMKQNHMHKVSFISAVINVNIRDMSKWSGYCAETIRKSVSLSLDTNKKDELLADAKLSMIAEELHADQLEYGMERERMLLEVEN